MCIYIYKMYIENLYRMMRNRLSARILSNFKIRSFAEGKIRFNIGKIGALEERESNHILS